MNDLERRFTPGAVELRAADDKRTIGGYAIVFNKLSRNLGGFVERVAPVAVNESRGREWPDVVARHNHDDNLLLGTTASGTLRLQVHDQGLRYDVEPPSSRSDILELVQRGDVRHSSFAFRTVADEWGTSDQGYPMRTLTNVQLVDVATVVSPAYPDSTAGLRSLAQKFEVDVEEVRSMAQADELRKFFVRTDKKGKPQAPAKPRTFGPAARMEILGSDPTPW